MNLFIIGAGFTRALIPDAPLNGDVLQRLIEAKHAIASQLKTQYDTADIEVALTKLDVDLASTKSEELRKLRTDIDRALAECFFPYHMTEEIYRRTAWLGPFIDNAFADGDVAISLNYDCVFEGALDFGSKWRPKGGYGTAINCHDAIVAQALQSPVAVLKLHGSVSFIRAPYFDNDADGAVGFDVHEHFFPLSGKNSQLRFGGNNSARYIIAPSYVKIPTAEIAYMMLDAIQASSHAKNLIIIGCQLRPEDSFLTLLVTNFLRQRDWQQRRIVIVDPDATAISERIRRYWGMDISQQVSPIPENLEYAVDKLLHEIHA